MDTAWKIRPYDTPAYARPVSSTDTADLKVGDVAVLRSAGDVHDEDIRVSIGAFEDDRLRGTISVSNRLGAAGDARFAVGLRVLFEERHVFRIERYP